MKKLYILIGPKGSGKSFIGKLMEEEFGIRFIRVEDWAKKIRRNRSVNDATYHKEVFEIIESGMRRTMLHCSAAVFESTGLTPYFDTMLVNLKKDFRVRLVGVTANDRICLERVLSRDQAIHINISDHQVLEINKKVREKDISPDFMIFNETADKAALTAQLRKILER